MQTGGASNFTTPDTVNIIADNANMPAGSACPPFRGRSTLPIPLLPLPQASKRSLLASTISANDPLTGPFRAAVADFNNDGVPDTVVVSPPGVPDRVVVTDGATGAVLFTTAPFGGSFTGGLFVTFRSIPARIVARFATGHDKEILVVFEDGSFVPIRDWH